MSEQIMSSVTPTMLPRTVLRSTTVVQGGRCRATILYPGQDPAYAKLAGRLADSIERGTGSRAAVLADSAAIPTRSTPLPQEYREQPLILLGNLNTNRAVLPLYARYYCATDAVYPGGDGYDLRTIVNPYGTGCNILLAGGSSLRGVERAVERLISRITEAGRTGELVLPFMLEVELEPALARLLAEWPETPLGVPMPTMETGLKRAVGFNEALIRGVGGYASMYAWTGDERYAQYSRDCLRQLNSIMTDSYGDWHYRAERIMRALPWLCAGGFLDEADILRTDQLLLGTALGTAGMWWRMRSDRPPLGHRHHGKGTYEFLLLARYLREQAAPDEAARALCDQWLDECHAFLDGLVRAGIDDQDDESTLNNLATLYWYALGEERYEFFESGTARLVARRAIALHDNMGAGAGQGGYGEGLAGAMYYQQEATTPVAASAFYYQDGELKWLLEHLPHLAIPMRLGFLGFAPIFMHKFDTGRELPPATPEGLSGLHVLPLAPYSVEINNHPPEHIEYAGHQVNAPETWLRAEGIGINTLPRERGFDKVLVRSGFAPEEAYLLLQGYQGGYRWQGHMQAANCIVRFSQGGHIFLIQNTSRHSHYQKNGLFVSDGYNIDELPPLAEWLAADDFKSVGLSVTRLSGFHGADWTRHLFWSKSGGGFFVVMDGVDAGAAGPRSVTCTWRTPGYASWDGHTWQARQGDYRFTLRSADRLPSTNGEEEAQGGENPYVLREVRAGDYRTGERITFQHLFYARPEAGPEEIDIQRLADNRALIRRARAPLAWCAVRKAGPAQSGPGVTVQAASAWVSAEEIALAGATRLLIAGVPSLHFSADRPVGLYFDLNAAQVSVRLDGPDQAPASVRTNAGGDRAITVKAGEDTVVALPASECRRIASLVRAELAALAAAPQPEAKAGVEEPTAQPDGWQRVWTGEFGSLLPKRLRDLTVAADPPPIDGFADQLIDTILPEMRETWQQWPAAPEYTVTLRFPGATPLSHLRIVGDSPLDPTLRTFNALPEEIAVTVSDDEFRHDVRECAVEKASGYLRWRRFRDMEDRMETRRVQVGQRARQVRIRIPAPAAGRPLVLHEIESYGDQQVPARVRHLLVADLQGDGRPNVIAVDAADQISVFAADGTRLWQQAIPGITVHVSCHDLDGNGRRCICLGLAGGELRVLSPEGELRQSILMGDLFLKANDAYFGWLNTIDSVAIWHREPGGRAAMVVGGYAMLMFLDPDGRFIGHSWSDGPWLTDLLPSAPDEKGACDLWVRTGWNHGIGFYQGYPGLAPSGEAIMFGGVRQSMFRPVRKIIPFVNGKTAAFGWLDDSRARGTRILVACENGVGILSTAGKDWLWKIEGGTPINACTSTELDGPEVVVTGGADGFVAAYAASNGRPVRCLYTGAPVVDLAPLSGGGMAVATRRGVLAVDKAWQVQGEHPAPVDRMRALDQNQCVVARSDGRLEMLRWRQTS